MFSGLSKVSIDSFVVSLKENDVEVVALRVMIEPSTSIWALNSSQRPGIFFSSLNVV